jgi:uncharacterized protein YqjF (DUF2071 family)
MSEREWRPALSMRWKHLLFVHWRVPVASLRPLIPEPLQIDTYDGAAWVGFVPFVMESVRPVWLPPIPKLFDFPEANVRTYVRYGEQRGVWFFSLDAAHRLGVWVARRFWKLPYYYARMWWEMLAPSEIVYTTTRKKRPRPYARVRYRFSGEPRETEPNTLEHFLVERYALFTAYRGELYRGGGSAPALRDSARNAAGVGADPDRRGGHLGSGRARLGVLRAWLRRAGVRATATAHRQRHRARGVADGV